MDGENGEKVEDWLRSLTSPGDWLLQEAQNEQRGNSEDKVVHSEISY